MHIVGEMIIINAEFNHLRFQNGTSSGHGGRRYFPYAFTEQGVTMLSAVLISETAIKKSNRFIIIDDKTVYHFGASLKDLGKKWFAFSKMDIGAIEMLTRLEGMKA